MNIIYHKILNARGIVQINEKAIESGYPGYIYYKGSGKGRIEMSYSSDDSDYLWCIEYFGRYEPYEVFFADKEGNIVLVLDDNWKNTHHIDNVSNHLVYFKDGTTNLPTSESEFVDHYVEINTKGDILKEFHIDKGFDGDPRDYQTFESESPDYDLGF